MDIMIIVYLIGIIVLVAFSAFFSSSETSFLSISKIQMRQYVIEKRPKANLISKLKSNIDSLLSTILVGNNFVNTYSSALATSLAISLFGDSGAGIATGIMTVIIIIFGEILPKTIATNHPYNTAKNFAIPLKIIKTLLFPIVWIFSLLSKLINKIETKIAPHKAPLITEEELKTLIDVGNKEGTLEAKEKTMLNKIFEFSDLRVRDILKPRTLVASLSVDSSYEEVVEKFSTSGYSRLPVYQDSFDNILGILHFKEVMFSGTKAKSSFNLKKLLKKATYVPETISAISLLRLLKKEKQNMAIVVDEHGCNCGLITMDDILRSVFGRITENFDDAEGNPVNRIHVINASKFSVPGEIRLEDLNSVFPVNLDSEEFDTLGGWLLEQFGSLPSTGEALKRGNVIYLVEDQAQRRIKSVLMTFV